jgi:hypothetical protein
MQRSQALGPELLLDEELPAPGAQLAPGAPLGLPLGKTATLVAVMLAPSELTVPSAMMYEPTLIELLLALSRYCVLLLSVIVVTDVYSFVFPESESAFTVMVSPLMAVTVPSACLDIDGAVPCVDGELPPDAMN